MRGSANIFSTKCVCSILVEILHCYKLLDQARISKVEVIQREIRLIGGNARKDYHKNSFWMHFTH